MPESQPMRLVNSRWPTLSLDEMQADAKHLTQKACAWGSASTVSMLLSLGSTVEMVVSHLGRQPIIDMSDEGKIIYISALAAGAAVSGVYALRESFRAANLYSRIDAYNTQESDSRREPAKDSRSYSASS